MHERRVIQDGTVVATVSSPDAQRASTEIARYALQYRHEGNVKVEEKRNGRWRVMYRLTHPVDEDC